MLVVLMRKEINQLLYSKCSNNIGKLIIKHRQSFSISFALDLSEFKYISTQIDKTNKF